MSVRPNVVPIAAATDDVKASRLWNIRASSGESLLVGARLSPGTPVREGSLRNPSKPRFPILLPRYARTEK